VREVAGGWGREPRGQNTGEEVVEGQRKMVTCKQGGGLAGGG